MINRPMLLVLVAVSTQVQTSIAQNFTPAREELKSLYIQSFHQPPGRQRVRLPLTDGRVIRLSLEYVLTSEGIQTKVSSENEICVTVDRRAAAVAAAAIDASIICSSIGLCGRLPSYVARMERAKNADQFVSEFMLVEEFDDAFQRHLRNWARTPRYAAAWLNGFESFILTFQLHEIGHVALGHRADEDNDDREIWAAKEAMADGFAVYASQLSNFANAAGSALVFSSLVRTTDRDARDDTPCRIEAFTMGLRNWAAKYHPNSPLTGRLPNVHTDRRHGSNFDFSHALPDLNGNEATCRAYAKSFFEGVKKASKLVTPQTNLEVDDEPGFRCSD